MLIQISTDRFCSGILIINFCLNFLDFLVFLFIECVLSLVYQIIPPAAEPLVLFRFLDYVSSTVEPVLCLVRSSIHNFASLLIKYVINAIMSIVKSIIKAIFRVLDHVIDFIL